MKRSWLYTPARARAGAFPPLAPALALAFVLGVALVVLAAGPVLTAEPMLAADPVLAAGPVATPAAAQTTERSREPLPLDVAVSLRSHNGRSPIHLSPDGARVAHTVETDETVARDSRRYSATGFPFAEGDSRMEATVTDTRTGESTRLGGPDSASWAAVWSPDGGRVAFYSDRDGEAGLWIWDATSGEAARFRGVIVRPFFGFEMPEWSPDGQRVLVKVLPEGMSVADANALERRVSDSSEPAEVEPGPASVRVRRVVPPPDAAEERSPEELPEVEDPEVQDPDVEKPEEEPEVEKPEVEKPGVEDPEVEEPPTRREPVGDLDPFRVDLAVLDLRSRAVTRIVEGQPISSYAFSPDGTRVAYTVLKGHEPASQQPAFDLVVRELASGSTRTLGTNLRMGYGIEWSWSPDGRRIAWIPSGQSARLAVAEGAAERIVVASVPDGTVTSIDDPEAPTLDPGDGEQAPLWDRAGEHLYAVGDGELWEADLQAGALRRVAAIDGWRIRAIVSRPHRDTVWTTDDGRTLWAVARSEDGAESGIHAIDGADGGSRAALTEPKSYSGLFSLDASEASGEIAFVSTDQQHPADIRAFDTGNGDVRQVSHINPALERYELGRARAIRWRSLDGEPLAGTLLLPPGHREGDRLPLVVWVYGGSMGSRYVNRFGLWGGLPAFNMHVLATRGYAVLFPDAPLRTGSPMRDLMATVMPGVNATIEQGYADPDRLAIMGQSYGSYSTLAIITQTDRFDAAVITAAVLHPDLFADYLGSTGYYEQGQGNMGGSIWEVPDRYLENSPLFRFDEIDTPLLIGQGEDDGDLVPSEAIFRALERLEKPVEYRVYEGEGHVITRRANVIDFWQRRLEFLAEHLDLEVDGQGAILRAPR